jgi:hypothetical protein
MMVTARVLLRFTALLLLIIEGPRQSGLHEAIMADSCAPEF